VTSFDFNATPPHVHAASLQATLLKLTTSVRDVRANVPASSFGVPLTVKIDLNLPRISGAPDEELKILAPS